MVEQKSKYYTDIYSKGYSVDRYKDIYEVAGKKCEGAVLDMACGTGAFKEYVSGKYDGFDFADVPGIRKGDLYTEPLEGFDTYVLLEVLEHVDDIKVLQRIPEGKNVIFSVPTFEDASHLRTYRKRDIKHRFNSLIDVSDIKTFSYDGKKHVESDKNPSIFLVYGKKKTKTATIGAYMIVRDEEAMLGTCLKSLKGMDEIVILDTGSKDKTCEVAKEFDCNYIADKYKWEDSFCKARNEAMKYTTADYLVVIDADEELKGGIKAIRKAIKNNPDKLAFNVKTQSTRSKNKFHSSVRVHRNMKEIFWKGDAHNYLTHGGDMFLEGVEIHYGYSPAHEKDPDRTFRILTKSCSENPEAQRERYYLAREYYYRKKYTEALTHLQIYWTHATFAKEIADSRLMAARCCIALKNMRDAWDHLFKALQINADLGEAYRLLASISGPKNKLTWQRMEAEATNQDALFVRL